MHEDGSTTAGVRPLTLYELRDAVKALPASLRSPYQRFLAGASPAEIAASTSHLVDSSVDSSVDEVAQRLFAARSRLRRALLGAPRGPQPVCEHLPALHRWVHEGLGAAPAPGCAACAQEQEWLVLLIDLEERVRQGPAGETVAPESPHPSPLRRWAQRAREAIEARPGALFLGGLGFAGVLAVGLLGTALPRVGPVPWPSPRKASATVSQAALPRPSRDQPITRPGPPPGAVEPPPRRFAAARRFPEGPPRLPHRPPLPLSSPPGPHQSRVVGAVRHGACADALYFVQRALEESPDHAAIVRGVWLCFNAEYQLQLQVWLEAERDPSPDEVVALLEGTEEDRARQLAADPWVAELPVWYRPAAEGLEYRLEELVADDRLAAIVTEAVGPPRMADTIAKDLFAEGQMAVGFSRTPPEERTPRVIGAWARRVYVLSWALARLPGRLLREWRPDVLELVREQLAEAVAPRPDPQGGAPWPVPAEVLAAKAAGASYEPLAIAEREP